MKIFFIIPFLFILLFLLCPTFIFIRNIELLMLKVGWVGMRKKKERESEEGKETTLIVALISHRNLSYCPYALRWLSRVHLAGKT